MDEKMKVNGLILLGNEAIVVPTLAIIGVVAITGAFCIGVNKLGTKIGKTCAENHRKNIFKKNKEEA